MFRSNEHGTINVLVVPLALLVLLFLGAMAFGYWAYGGRQDYKNNVDQKIAVAVDKAKQDEDKKKDAEFAEEAKQPLKTYTGPEAFGAVKVSFPKTWSAYVDETSGSYGIDGFFNPNTVPSIISQSSTFALRVQVVNQSYSNQLSGYQGFAKGGKGTITAYSLPKLPSVVGIRLDGEVVSQKVGSMIVLPLRDKTLKIWTEAPAFVPDFNNNILPNLTFSP